MVNNYEELLKSLRDGADATEIANSFADMLNKATAQIRQEEEEKRAKEAAAAKKYEHFNALLSAAIGYMNDYYPDVLGADFLMEDQDRKRLYDAMDSAYEDFKRIDAAGIINPLWDSIAAIDKGNAKATLNHPKGVSFTADVDEDVLKKFLDMLDSME